MLPTSILAKAGRKGEIKMTMLRVFGGYVAFLIAILIIVGIVATMSPSTDVRVEEKCAAHCVAHVDAPAEAEVVAFSAKYLPKQSLTQEGQDQILQPVVIAELEYKNFPSVFFRRNEWFPFGDRPVHKQLYLYKSRGKHDPDPSLIESVVFHKHGDRQGILAIATVRR